VNVRRSDSASRSAKSSISDLPSIDNGSDGDYWQSTEIKLSDGCSRPRCIPIVILNQVKRTRRPLGTFLKLFVTIAALSLIIWKLGGTGEVAHNLIRISPAFVLMTLAAITIDRLVMTYKWTLLLRSQDINVTFLRTMKIYCASMVWGMFMPMTIGADAVRIYMTAQTGAPAKELVASVVIERIFGFFASLLVALAGLVLIFRMNTLDPRLEILWWLALSVLIGGLLALPLSFSERVFELFHNRLLFRFRDSKPLRILREIHTNYRSYRKHGLMLILFLALSVIEQILTVLCALLVAIAINLECDLLLVGAAFPVAILVARLPISVHGLGVLDGIFALLISVAGVALADAIAVTMGLRILEITAWSPWWFASVFQSGSLRRPACAT
jgi:glycosyltransferase 2 family protein